MNTGEDVHGMRKILDGTRWISVGLLLLHFYDTCYAAFRKWGLRATISDNILENIQKTGLFNRPDNCKGMALAFLLISLLGVRGRKEETYTYRAGGWLMLLGLLTYLGSRMIFSLDAGHMTLMCGYMGATFVGYLLVLSGGVRLSRVISRSLRGDAFRKDNEGFQQEERLRETDFSLNLRGRYQ